MRIFILLLLVVGTQSAIQLDKDCLNNPSKCDDDAFSVAEFTLCSGEVFPLVDGASKGTGNRASGCGFGEVCNTVFPGDELNNETWGTNATKAGGGCDYVKYVGLNPTQAKLDAKISACKKWLSEDVGVCQGAIWVPIVIWGLVVVILIALILLAIYLKYPDMLPKSVQAALKKMDPRNKNKYQRLPRNF
jgi:hypothetical protein